MYSIRTRFWRVPSEVHSSPSSFFPVLLEEDSWQGWIDMKWYGWIYGFVTFINLPHLGLWISVRHIWSQCHNGLWYAEPPSRPLRLMCWDGDINGSYLGSCFRFQSWNAGNLLSTASSRSWIFFNSGLDRAIELEWSNQGACLGTCLMESLLAPHLSVSLGSSADFLQDWPRAGMS